MLRMEVLVPSLGILLFNNNLIVNSRTMIMFSSPLWGFFYLMAEWLDESTEEAEVLVPSLGILLFNFDEACVITYMDFSSRPLSGDSFI